jgi:hypothetical protein
MIFKCNGELTDLSLSYKLFLLYVKAKVVVKQNIQIDKILTKMNIFLCGLSIRPWQAVISETFRIKVV